MMKSILTTIAFLALAVSGLAQARSVIVNTGGVVQSPTNFWSANATNARSGLGLGTAATNAASAFQPSSATLSNLSLGNGAGLTNLTAANITGTVGLASNVTGTIAISNGGSGATTAGGARTNLGLGATNSVLFSNISATGYISMGISVPLLKSEAAGVVGFYDSVDDEYILSMPSDTDDVIINAQWNNAGVRSNLGLSFSALTNTNTSNFRTAIGLGTAATNPATAFQPSSSALTNLANNNGSSLTNISAAGVVGILTTNGNGAGLTNLTAANITGTVGLASNVTGTIAISNGGSGAITIGGARTNFGLGASNVPTFSNVVLNEFLGGTLVVSANSGGSLVKNSQLSVAPATTHFLGSVGFTLTNWTVVNARTNLGLGWPALTNTSSSGFLSSLFGSNTNPVLYNTNGEVVSPTNFWQVAPIVTRFVESQPVVSQTTNITAARNLHIHSLAISTTGVTNTIALPTTNSFNGDIALVVHQGPTSSVTAIRTAGAGTNLITLNRFEEAVEFVYYNNVWQFNHNPSFTEPLYFSGTNTAANAAATRTNLGLGSTNSVTFGPAILSKLNLSNSSIDIGATSSTTVDLTYTGVPLLSFGLSGISFGSTSFAAVTRTNLGLPLAALTNANNANFQAAVFATNTTPTNAGNFNTHAAWMEVTVQTNGSNVSFRIPLYK